MKKIVFKWEDSQSCDQEISTRDEFFEKYTHIRVYHSCKPTDIESYYKHGFQLPELSELKKQMKSLPDYNEEHIAFNEIDVVNRFIFFRSR